MKKMLVIASALVLIAQAACTPVEKPQTTPDPTAQATSAPTEKPTEETTESPTAEPTEAHTAEPTVTPTEEPIAFPTPGRLGNLVNGEAVLPEGVAYFVLDGESDVHYVYDRFGELLATFTAPSDDFNCWSNSAGIYGEYGVPYGYCIKRGEMMPADIIDFANRLFEYRKIWDEEDEYSEYAGYNGFVWTAFWDEKLERRIEFDRPMGFGFGASILPVDDKLILIADRDVEENGEQVSYTEAIMLDENGKVIGDFDPETFGGIDMIEGVLADRYLLVKADDEAHPLELDSDWPWYRKYDLYSLSGECILRDCWAVLSDRFHYWDGAGRGLVYAYCFINRQGEVFDGELNLLYTVPEGTDLSGYNIVPSEYGSIFHNKNDLCGYTVDQEGIYAGVKDEEGNWVFKIYNPKLASDSQPETEPDDEW
jgi:hypothetical protein